MIGSEFGVNSMKAWSILTCLNGSGCWWWCNGGGDIFVARFVPSEHCLNTTVYLSIVADHVHPFMISVPSSDDTSSRIMHHVTKLKSSQTGFLNMTMSSLYSTVTRSQSNRASLGCGGTGDSHHGCAADKSAATAWCYHVNMEQNLWEMFPTPCWIYATKN